MKTLYRKTFCFLLFLLLPFHLHGADINATIVQGTTKTYESILAGLKKSRADDTVALQRALLYKLINISKEAPPKSPKIEPPKDEKEYRHLAKSYGEWSLQKLDIQKSLEEIENKKEVIENQIAHIDANTSSLLTLQLQYAFYKKGENLYQQKLGIVKGAIQKAPDAFVKGLKRIDLDINASKSRLETIEKDISKIDKEIQRDEVERERLNLLGRTTEAQKLNDAIENLQKKRIEAINDKLLELFIQFSYALQRKKSDQVFALHQKMMDIAKAIYPDEVRDNFQSLFTQMETAMLGRATTIKGATFEKIKSALSLFLEEVNAPIFTINGVPISAAKMFFALLVFILGFFIGGFYKSHVARISLRNGAISASTRTLLANLGYYLIVIIAFFIALNIVGINLSSIALVAGALSVGIGFGLQNIVSNFVSGIILMFERSIKIGDYIELDENLRGHVSDIRMRSTTINTNDNIDVIVPNQDLIQNRVINWTMNDRIRRFKIPFGVAYGTDANQVKDVVLAAVAKSGFDDIYSDLYRNTRVIMTGMGDSSVDFELMVWIEGPEIFYPKRTISRFLTLIYTALNEAGIEIPFPQRDLHLRSVDSDVVVPVQLNNRDKCMQK